MTVPARYLAVLVAGVIASSAACIAAAENPVLDKPDSRPIGISETASPNEKGREIMRVVFALVKHGDLRDTEFASKLLRLPLVPNKGLVGPNPPTIPQKLVQSFRYVIADTGIPHQFVGFDLTPSEVCLKLEEFLLGFNENFGIGMDIVKDSPSPPHRTVSPAQGWRQKNYVHATQALYIYQSMPTGLGVTAVFVPTGCAGGITVEQFKPFKS